VGDAKAGRRKRAVGTRDRVLGHLAAVGEVSDEGGKASILLAAAVGYPGSSVAFAQLLTGMERAGLIERDVRGKRTYRIAPGRAAVASVSAAPAEDGAPAAVTPARPAAARPANPPARRRDRRAADPGPGAGLAALAGADGLDYDELARRLLIQVVQQLTNPPGADLEAVASLEQKLASAASRQRKLTAENTRLREQLREAQQSLAAAQERAGAEAERFGTAELRLLERLLAPLREPGGQEEAGAG
jgi:hypothetical protein